MKIALLILAGLAVLAVAASLYVRLAPLPGPGAGERRVLHPPLEGDPGGYARSVQATPEQVAALDAAIRATPRTRLLEGSLEQGHLRYVTRSLIWGFPDITELTVVPGSVTISGHLVYGRSDLGVNRRRIEGWLAQLGPG